MKNTLYTTLAVLLLGSLCYFGLPWWSVAVVAVVAGFLWPQPAGRGFATAFSAGFALWWGWAFFAHSQNGGKLTAMVGQVFQGLQSWHLLTLTGTLGGLLAGLGVLAGIYTRTLGDRPQRRPERRRRRRR